MAEKHLNDGGQVNAEEPGAEGTTRTNVKSSPALGAVTEKVTPSASRHTRGHHSEKCSPEGAAKLLCRSLLLLLWLVFLPMLKH